MSQRAYNIITTLRSRFSSFSCATFCPYIEHEKKNLFYSVIIFVKVVCLCVLCDGLPVALNKIYFRAQLRMIFLVPFYN